MSGIYFIDDDHKMNYQRVLFKWPSAMSNLEYQTACYILAVPLIYKKVEKLIDDFKYPVDWIWRWEYKYTLPNDTNYCHKGDDVKKPPYDLTNSMVQLGKLALNMWNGYEHFNLLNCITRLDNDNYRVAMCAINMRMGHFRREQHYKLG